MDHIITIKTKPAVVQLQCLASADGKECNSSTALCSSNQSSEHYVSQHVIKVISPICIDVFGIQQKVSFNLK